MKQCVPDVCFSLNFLFKSTANMSQTRRETDSFGPMEVPAQYYYGAVTARSLVNFNIGGERERMPVSSSRIILRRSQCAVVHYSTCVLDLSFCPCVRLSLFWYVLECSSLLFGHSAFSSKLQRRSTRWWGGLKVAWQRRSFRLARRCVVAANFCCMACCFHFESHGHPRVVPLHQLETVWVCGDRLCMFYRVYNTVQNSRQEISPTDAWGQGFPPGRGHGGSISMQLRMGQPMAVHTNRQLIDWAGAGYFPAVFPRCKLHLFAWRSARENWRVPYVRDATYFRDFLAYTMYTCHVMVWYLLK